MLARIIPGPAYAPETPLYQIIGDGWGRGFQPEQTIEEALSMGFTLSIADLQAAWAAKDAEYDAYVDAQLSTDLGQQFYASVVGSDDFTEMLVKRATNDNLEPLGAMTILTPIMDIHITCEQAMKFFGLVKPTA